MVYGFHPLKYRTDEDPLIKNDFMDAYNPLYIMDVTNYSSWKSYVSQDTTQLCSGARECVSHRAAYTDRLKN